MPAHRWKRTPVCDLQSSVEYNVSQIYVYINFYLFIYIYIFSKFSGGVVLLADINARVYIWANSRGGFGGCTMHSGWPMMLAWGLPRSGAINNTKCTTPTPRAGGSGKILYFYYGGWAPSGLRIPPHSLSFDSTETS